MDLLSNETGVLQDINFNGDKTVLVAGTNEWAQIDLRQVGGRRNVASHAIADAVGPLSLDLGQGDNGQGDNGQGDNGQGDNGQGDNGQGDNGQGDNGQGDNGQGDNGAPPEMDSEAASDGPHQRKPAFAKQGGPAVILSWTQSHVGPAVSFEVWRSVGTHHLRGEDLDWNNVRADHDVVRWHRQGEGDLHVCGGRDSGRRYPRDIESPDNHDQVVAAAQPDGPRHLTRPARLRISGNRGSSPALSRIVRYTRYESTKPVLFSPSRTRPW